MAYVSKFKDDNNVVYDFRAYKTAAIPYGEVDSTSTSTAYTATVDGIVSLYDGVCVLLKNGVVTSAENFTINVNGLGALPVYSNMAAATRETTIFNINYTLLFVYDSTRVDGGCWVNYRGYYSDSNSIGYQLRTNSGTLPTTDKFYRYRILFTSADGTKWIPSNTSTSTNATAKRDVNQRPINPFGPIVYYSTTDAVEANAVVSASYLWQQYAVTFGYAFNRTGAALVLTYPAPVYIKCAPQSNGSAIIDADTPYVQALPNTEDNKIYIFLGIAYSATNVEIRMEHPIYYYKDNAIRIWTNSATSSGVSTVSVVQTLTSGTKIGTITVDSVGTDLYAPTPPTTVSQLTNDSGYITGISSSDVTAALGYTPYNSTNPNNYVNATQAANAAPVQSVNGSTGAVTVSVPTASSTNPNMDGAAAVGSSANYAREDHVHPSDTSLVPTTRTINGQALSSDITLDASDVGALPDTTVFPEPATANPIMDSTAAVGTSTKYAREDHVHPSDTSKAGLDSPSFTGTPTAPTASAGTDNTQIATTAFVNAAVNSFVGQYSQTPNAVSVASATNTTIANTESLEANCHYIILAKASFAANTTGRRVMFLATSTTGSNIDRFCINSMMPVSGTNVATDMSMVYLCHPTSATTYYLRVYQNAGSSLNVTGGLRVFKFKVGQ